MQFKLSCSLHKHIFQPILSSEVYVRHSGIAQYTYPHPSVLPVLNGQYLVEWMAEQPNLNEKFMSVLHFISSFEGIYLI